MSKPTSSQSTRMSYSNLPSPQPRSKNCEMKTTFGTHTNQSTLKSLDEHSFASRLKGKQGIARILKAASYSTDGFKAAYQNEAAFRQVVWLNSILLVGIVFIPFTLSIKMTLVFASFLSLITELINTGIEASIDHTSTEQHPLAKIAKDVGSAAQFLALLLLFILWAMAMSTLAHMF